MYKNEAAAEKITQETFVKSLESLDRFDGRCKIYVCLCQFAKNTYYSWCRKEKHINRHADTHGMESAENLEDKLLHMEEAFEIHRCLHTLEEPYKGGVSLRLFGELSFATDS